MVRDCHSLKPSEVDAEHPPASTSAGTLCVVAGIDACADDIALVVLVQQLVDVLLVGVIVLAENHIQQATFLVDQGQELILLSQMISLQSCRLVVAGAVTSLSSRVMNSVTAGSIVMQGQAVVAAGHDAQQLAVGGAVVGDSDGGVTSAGLEVEHIAQGSLRGRLSQVTKPFL